jgi:hypothetical protein
MKKHLSLIALLIWILFAVSGCGGVPAEDTAASVDWGDDFMPALENNGIITDTVVDVFKEPNIHSERITQALCNQVAKILNESDGWSRVTTADNCTGWIRSRYIVKDCSSISGENCKFRIIVTAKSAVVYSHPVSGATIMETVMGTEFCAAGEKSGFYGVVLPGGVTGWIRESAAIRLSFGVLIPKTSGSDFLATVEKFKGTSYLQGGVSLRGVDSSGLTYVCARINGVDLSRHVKGQSGYGLNVAMESLKPGDLVFFGSPGDGEITDVAVYAGGGEIIHSSKIKGYVTTDRLDDEYFQKRFKAARRIF